MGPQRLLFALFVLLGAESFQAGLREEAGPAGGNAMLKSNDIRALIGFSGIRPAGFGRSARSSVTGIYD